MTNNSAKTQEFFSDVVTGKSDIFKPIKPWRALIKFSKFESKFKNIFDRYMGLFDIHIATSIPTFREAQIVTGAAICKIFKGGLMYDIGGSEGGYCKAVSRVGKLRTINLDPNSDMQAIHEATPAENCVFIKEAFLEGFEYDGQTYKAHIPKEKADVVHEAMTFQFISKEREAFVHHVKKTYLKEGGLFLTEEKFDSTNYATNEAQKQKYKDLYYSKEQQELKSETVLTGMKENQISVVDYLAILRQNFKHVQIYWASGNFLGMACTDDTNTIVKFMNETGMVKFEGATLSAYRVKA